MKKLSSKKKILQIRMLNKNKKLNFRTAAYAIALKKLRKFHDAVGVYG